MNNTGSPVEPELNAPAPPADGQARRGVRWVLLALLVLVIGVVGVFGFRFIGVLIVLIAPPSPPVPPAVTEAAHENLAHGVDSWDYVTADTAEALVAFFSEQGGACAEVMLPQSDVIGAYERPGYRCAAADSVSIFDWRWQADILTLSDGTRLHLTRTVYWMGEAPAE